MPNAGQVDGVVVEVALQWCSDTFSDLLIGFVNSVKTIDGGTHIDGLKVCSILYSHAAAATTVQPWALV